MTPEENPTRPAPTRAEGAPGIERTTVVAYGDGVDISAVSAFLHRLSGLDVVGLAPLLRTTAVPGGVALTHLVPVDAVTVTGLAPAWTLEPGHVLSVARSVAASLVGVHGAGFAHGGVTPDNVLVGLDGSIVLTSSGAAHARVADPPRAADDVAALGELVRDLLGPGSAPASLVVAALRASDTDPLLRPSASGLLAALERCGAATPLLELLWDTAGRTDPVEPLLPHGARWSEAAVERSTREVRVHVSRSAVPPRPARRRARRVPPSSMLRLFGVAALAVVGIGALAALGRPDALADVVAPPTASATLIDSPGPRATAAPREASIRAATSPSDVPSSPVPSAYQSRSAHVETPSRPTPPDAVGARIALEEIDAGRTAAIAVGSVLSLRGWVDPSGPAWAADARTAADVHVAGARLEGGQLVIESVEVLAEAADRAELRVTDRRSAYAVVVGGSRHEVAARGPRSWDVTLTRSEQGEWRIFAVAPAAPPTISPAGRR